MPTVSDLVEFFAEATGTRPEEGKVRARHLREAGLLPSGGRGRGGAEVNARHCARYLVAWMAAERAINAPEAFRVYDSIYPSVLEKHCLELGYDDQTY
ncbi:MAG: hypothetical protein AAF530_17435 [Pseudomonadota bacterium]